MTTGMTIGNRYAAREPRLRNLSRGRRYAVRISERHSSFGERSFRGTEFSGNGVSRHEFRATEFRAAEFQSRRRIFGTHTDLPRLTLLLKGRYLQRFERPGKLMLDQYRRDFA